MKLAFFETTPQEKEKLPALLSGQDFVSYQEKIDDVPEADLPREAEIISVFVNSRITPEIIDKFPRLKLIATRSTGFDHIDIAYAKQKGVAVANVPAYGSRTVAEFTFGLILNLSRKIFKARHQLLEGSNFDISRLAGFDLYGKTLGVIGTGRIGCNVIKIARGFEMNILAFDSFPNEKLAGELGFKYAALPELLSQSDIITLHVPLNESTRHLINKNNIGAFKKGSYLINTSRGEVVETAALVEGLAGGRLAGAGLDVWESERELKEEAELLQRPKALLDFKTLFQNHVLMNSEEVMVTPHIAFFSREAEEEILETTAANIIGFINSNPQNLVR